ncbi:glutathione synthetase-like isoform X2 [Diabrotica virgifera virgifera]|uniref:Glutathione synthetase n=1 Tax=Diabrotica virgifera virgifera TaxID=50390 RepID=A0ABM5KT32_DIAVI|nr:glutathione synthetase-like isoform X2 [Diabrotica virgifera virgifera]
MLQIFSRIRVIRRVISKCNIEMSSYTPTVVPLPLPEDVLKDLVTKGKDWAITNGTCMRSKTNFSEDSVNFAPFVLLPSTMPRRDFEQVVSLQTAFQELIHYVANDREFLTKCLTKIIEVDSFTAKLFEIYETVQEEGETQPISVGVLRCDYMMETEKLNGEKCHENGFPPFSWKLVEINNIAAGFGWLGPASGLLHRYILQEMNLYDKSSNLPENNCLSEFCKSFLEAWKIYGNCQAVILMVVEDVIYNICDQRHHEFKFRELNPQVKFIRRTLTEIYKTGKLNEKKELVVGNDVVSVVYFRCGYNPLQYPTENEWTARLLIERSKAIKCPNIQYHLAGTKKVQQELAKPGVIDRFIKDRRKVELIRDVFVGIYGLEFDDDGEKAVRMALKTPERYVLKPQREGGGNNVYGKDVKEYLERMANSKERESWIMMERIIPPIIRGYMVKPGGSNPPPISEMILELGIFGIIIGTPKTIITNIQTGHMVRSKIATANEGGVMIGLGALDSPYLLQ